MFPFGIDQRLAIMRIVNSYPEFKFKSFGFRAVLTGVKIMLQAAWVGF